MTPTPLKPRNGVLIPKWLFGLIMAILPVICIATFVWAKDLDDTVDKHDAAVTTMQQTVIPQLNVIGSQLSVLGARQDVMEANQQNQKETLEEIKEMLREDRRANRVR